jgi:hypothetical protein
VKHALVVDVVHMAVQRAPVEQTVRPVEPSVVQYIQNRDHQDAVQDLQHKGGTRALLSRSTTMRLHGSQDKQ